MIRDEHSSRVRGRSAQEPGFLVLAFVCVVLILTAGCGFQPYPAAIVFSASQMQSGTTQQFSAAHLPTPIVWSVNGVAGGTAQTGTIDSTGLYQAPAVALAAPVTITASSSIQPGMSVSTNIQLLNPAPKVTDSTPGIAVAGSEPLQLRVSGENFSPVAQVSVDGSNSTATIQSTSQLVVTLDPALLQNELSVQVRVINPQPGGGTAELTVPVLSPAKCTVGVYGQHQYTVSNLPGGTIWMVNGIVGGNAASGTISPTGLYVSPAVAPASPVTIGVTSGSDPTLQASAIADVVNPVPTITDVSPRVTALGSVPLSVSVSGDNFVQGSSVSVGRTVYPATFVNKTTLSVLVPQIDNTDTSVPLTVINPAPGGGSSVSTDIKLVAGTVAPTIHPLVAEYDVTVPEDGKVSVEFGQDQTYGRRTAAIDVPNGGGTVPVLVAGMKANTGYHMRAQVQLANGTTLPDADHVFTTGPLPDGLPLPTLTMSGENSGGLELIGPINQAATVLDRDGSVIWYYSDGQGYIFPARQLPNGDFLLNYSTDVREVDLTGTIRRQITFDQLAAAIAATGSSMYLIDIHHDVIALPNGNWVLLTKEQADVPVDGMGVTTVYADALVEVDANNKVVWLWRALDHLDVNRHPYGIPDWTHGNSIAYTPDGNLLFSMRHQNWVIKIDFEDGHGSGDVLWRLGQNGDFTLAGGDDSEWFYGQHFVNRLTSDPWTYKLALFDNGNQRPLPDGETCDVAGGCYSRGVVFNIDEVSRTASVDWQYRLGWYAFWGGSIVQLPNGNFDIDSSTVDGGTSRVVEVTGDPSAQLLWTLSADQNFYRAVRIPSLYPGVQW